MDAKPKKKRKLVLVACPLVGLVVTGDSGLLKHQFGSKQGQAEAVMLICGDMRLMCDVV